MKGAEPLLGKTHIPMFTQDSPESPKPIRQRFKSERSFVLSLSAAAVGLGNLWRFPYIVGLNGGGSYVLAQIIAMLLVSFPLMWLSIAAGRLSQKNVVHCYGQVHKAAKVYGWFVVLLTIAITSYYLVVTGWCLGYAVDAVNNSLVVFKQFSSGYKSLYYFVVVAITAPLVLVKGVDALQKSSRILMPILMLIMLSLVTVATQTDGWSRAVAYLVRFDVSRLKSVDLWVFALGQAFYTVVFLECYGSYIPEKTHVPRAALIVSSTEFMVSLLSGFFMFPFIFALDLEPTAGSELAFNTLPLVFKSLTGGYWLGIMFFMLFFLAAFSSCIAGLKVIISAVEEEFKLKPKMAVLVVGFLMLVLGTPSALSSTPLQLKIGDESVLDFVDRFTGTTMVIFSGFFGAFILTWFIPKHKIHRALGVEHRWWTDFIYVIGRWSPIFVLIFVVVRFVLSLV
ncbi:hypothetical protein P9112_000746 [Eukaryota sp. TZLM1-RC]